MANKQNRRGTASKGPPPANHASNPPPRFRLLLKPPKPQGQLEEDLESGTPAISSGEPSSKAEGMAVYTEEMARSDIVPCEAPSQSPAPSSHTEVSRSSYGTKRHASLSTAEAPSGKKRKPKGSDSDSSVDSASDSDIEIVQPTARKKDKPRAPPCRKNKGKGEHAALKAKKSRKSAAKDEEGSDDNAPYKNTSLGVSIPRRRQSSASAVGTFGAPHDADRLQHNAPWCQQSQHLAPTVPATFGISYPSASGFLGVGIVRISRRRHCSASAVGTFGAPHDADWLQHNVPWYQSQCLAPTATATFGISYPSASGFLGVGIVRISRRRHCSASAVGTFGAPHDADRLQHNAPRCQQSQHLAPTVPPTFGISYPLVSGFLGVGIVSNPRRQRSGPSAHLTMLIGSSTMCLGVNHGV
ncbi:hypothetical protein B0H34DRAFT_863634 [Crassisporium funariophilum]|nr:hypothetical protein B0H34DRAFT_863634 [Crassisporium funariophilum]